MNYKDEKGNVLYGYSQHDLDRNTRAVNRLLFLGWMFYVYLLVMTVYVIKNDVVNNLVSACL